MSTVRRQRKVDDSAQLTFSFVFTLGLQSMGLCQPHSGCVFLSLLTQSRNALAYMPGGCLGHYLSSH